MYVDSSALLKLYIEEPESDELRKLVKGNRLFSGRLTLVEIRASLGRLLRDRTLDEARAVFQRDWGGLEVIELDAGVCARAAEIGESLQIRALDALHLGAADRLRGSAPFLTYDVRQARAARELGWRVLGA